MDAKDSTGHVGADIFLMFAGVFGMLLSFLAVIALVLFAYVGTQSGEFHPVSMGICATMIVIGVWNAVESLALLNAPSWRRFKFIVARSALAASPLLFVVILMWKVA